MKNISRSHILLRTLVLSAFMGTSHLALAQATEELDIEIFIVDEDATPAEVINRIELPEAATVEIPAAPTDDPLDELNTSTDATLDDATRTVTETINDAISSGDITKLPAEVDELIPDEVIDQIIEGADIQLPVDLSAPADTLNDAADSVQDTVPELPVQIDNIDAALDDLEADLNNQDIQLPELDQTIESLPTKPLPAAESLPTIEALPDMEIPDNTVEDAVKTLEESTEDASSAADDLVPDLLNR